MRMHYVAALHLLLTFWAMTGMPVEAAPVAEFETTSFDLGKPLEGEKAEAVFTLKNTGDTNLEITKVHAGCGCTKTTTSETSIVPGKTAVIKATFNTSGYPGEIFKVVTVITNDPDHSRIELKLAGEVMPVAEIKPQPSLNLGDVKPGAVILSDLVIVPKTEKQFRLTKVESSTKQITTLAFDKRRNKAGDYALKIRFMAGDTIGRFFEQVSVITDFPGNLPIKILVYGNVVSDTAAQGDKTP